ncbi:spore cortex-lytic protein [Roseburia sp. AM23-20]|jgi:uncharacterized protein YgiM (DUF1202 family)|uniref:cell wall hydrolase n=1 Tax=Roseburia sp. AM23-20 TaxID=2292066 RepID=UPI000E4B69A5|nr:cell wall hydrolase [Roseburia sp. AM23-20]RHF94127.1 spore cortex-lytic protein [Roseburia sp. AM23-20]
MNLRKRAISGIMLAGSMVVMCAIADAASTVSAEAVAVVADTRTDLATDGTAGVVAQLNQVSTDAVEMAAAGVENSQTILVASADEEAQVAEDTEEASAVQEETVSVEKSAQADSKEDETTQEADAVEDVQNADVDSETDTENTVDVENTKDIENTKETENIEDTENIQNTENAEWQNRLMADVDEFLYVRASGDADAEIIGKLYKGDVADVVENGDTWTHVVSGDVDGYVNNDYCVSGEDALDYAQENVETEAQVNTNGLRVRNAASEDASVITAVSEGTTLTVDTDAETEDGWVAVKYKGQTAYVSADYVTTELALGEAVTIEEEKAALAKKAEEEAAAKAAQTKETTTVQNASVSASYDDVTLLAALIQCEAGNELYEGQLAVGAVVMNRLRSGAYPSSISGVIYQSGQFPPAGQGMVASIAANGPKSSCVQAAQQALGGSDNTGGATCFSRASSGRAGVVIGNHVFY